MKTRALLTLGFAALVCAPANGLAQARSSAPARADAVRYDMPYDANFPPGIAELRIPSRGEGMNGFMYLPSGSGSHPVAIVLHGFPGNEKNTDIAQAIRRAGFNVLYFDYRGSWGSGGTFSFDNARQDVASALAWLRDPANVAKYRLDPRRIAIIGHSMGGWLALDGTAADTRVGCVAAIAAWNIAAGAKMMAADTSVRAAMVSYARVVTDPSAGPLRTTAAAIINEIETRASSWDYLRLAPALKDRAVLLVAATHDSPDEGTAMHASMQRALLTAGARRVQNVKYEDDHSISAHRIEMTDLILRWLRTDCAAVWSGRR